MFFLETLNRVVAILVGFTTLAEKGVAYIKRRRETKEKDPSRPEKVICLIARPAKMSLQQHEKGGYDQDEDRKERKVAQDP